MLSDQPITSFRDDVILECYATNMPHIRPAKPQPSGQAGDLRTNREVQMNTEELATKKTETRLKDTTSRS